MCTMTDEQKIYELSKIWKEAEYNFAFWDKVDLDWDEEYRKALKRVLATPDLYQYYRELSRFVALLGDGHTTLTFPMDIMQDPEYFSMLPVYLWRFGEDIAVINVTEEYKDKIALYSVLKKIDDIDASEYVRENCYPYIWHANEEACGIAAMSELMFGRAGSGAVYTFEKNGEEYSVQLTRENPVNMKWSNTDYSIRSDIQKKLVCRSDSFALEMTDDNIAILKMTTFSDNSMPEKIYEQFDELKKAVGYIIDVRANNGGNSINSDAVAALFIKGEFISCAGESQVYEPTYKAWAVFRDDLKNLTPDELDDKYSEDDIKMYRMSRHIFYRSESDNAEVNAPGILDGPIVVLMNEYTISAAEDFVDVMKMYTDAVFIGNHTAGSDGQPLVENLESGGSFRICTRRCIAQNGEDIYNKGFSPDVKVVGTLGDFIDRRDKTMEKGIGILREKLSVKK